ncbi:MAG: DnaD domain protein [Anaeroplasmataceae bacterium]|nr:DnaD domain protein [Anaeroplasmataceae bacterium]
MEALAPKKLNIYSSFSLSSDDVSTLSLLYAPLIGGDAVMLYFGLESLLERNNLKSETYTHQEILDLFNLTEKSFLKARYQLEGIGLLITYEAGDETLYVISAPLSPKNFIKDATLGLYLSAKIGKELSDKVYNHFKIEKIDKSKFKNVTKSFEDVYTSVLNEDVGFSKFQYLLGRKPVNNIKINNNKFNFDAFQKQINLDFLETGITKQFKDQINNLAFVYAFDEAQMANLYNESINRTGLFDYRLLKKKANILYSYLHHMDAPKLITKEEENIESVDLIEYLDNASPSEILSQIMPDFPPKYLNTIEEIYANIDLPKGVLNCMIIKVLKEKSGELPTLAYFKKVSETWVSHNIFTTSDAIKYSTTFEAPDAKKNKTTQTKYKTGGFDSL